MKKFFITVISLVMVASIAYGIAYFVLPVSSMELTRHTHSIGFVCENAYIVRDETVYNSNTDGIVYNIAQEGDRIALDSSISTVYNGDVDEQKLKQLRTIDSKISNLKGDGHNSELYKSDSDSTEIMISDNMEDILTLAEKNDVSSISELKKDINTIRQGDSVSNNTKIENLTAERNKIEQSISGGKSDILSMNAGVFSSYVDGLESVLTPDKVKEISVAGLNALEPKTSEYINGKKTTAGKPICKIINNHVWYIAGTADSSQVKMLEETPEVTVRFPGVSETDVSGKVVHISSPDAGGNCVFMVEISTYVSAAFSYRKIDAQIIFKEYSGYKVPTDSIRTRKELNSYYVYARKGSESYECDIDVLYSDTKEGFSIIKSTDTAENKLGSMERLIVGER